MPEFSLKMNFHVIDLHNQILFIRQCKDLHNWLNHLSVHSHHLRDVDFLQMVKLDVKLCYVVVLLFFFHG